MGQQAKPPAGKQPAVRQSRGYAPSSQMAHELAADLRNSQAGVHAIGISPRARALSPRGSSSDGSHQIQLVGKVEQQQ